MSAHQPGRMLNAQLHDHYQNHYNNHNRSMTTIITENMASGKTAKDPNRTAGKNSALPSAGPSPAAGGKHTLNTNVTQSSADMFRIRFNMLKQ